MILYLIYIAFFNLINAILGNSSIPQFDAIGDIFVYFNTLIGYGLGIYKYFIPPFGQVVILLIIGIKVFHFIYVLIKYIIQLIPMANIRM